MKNFYDKDYVPSTISDTATVDIDLSNPNNIFEYLISKVGYQDDYCKDVAMILWKHIRGQRGAYFVSGPSGCGKTYTWETLKSVYPNIVIHDASSISGSGWSGSNKVTSFAAQLKPGDSDYIVVFDESDKLFTPRYEKNGGNVSADIASEFLKLVDGMIIDVKDKGTYDTSKMTFIFCGSFGKQAEEISKEESSSGFGFGQTAQKKKAYERDLTIQDLIDAGVIRELASRAIKVCHVRPLSEDDYKCLLKDHSGSPVKVLEKKNDIRLKLSDKFLDKVASNAYRSGLGIRNCGNQIQRLIDDKVFENFRNNGTKPNEISL